MAPAEVAAPGFAGSTRKSRNSTPIKTSFGVDFPRLGIEHVPRGLDRGPRQREVVGGEPACRPCRVLGVEADLGAGIAQDDCVRSQDVHGRALYIEKIVVRPGLDYVEAA